MFYINDSKNRYFLIMDTENSKCFGEVSFHDYNSSNKSAKFDIKVKPIYRGKGIAFEAMDLMLDYYFSEWNGEVIEDSLREQNINGLSKMLEYGFREVKRDSKGVWIKMEKEEWIMKRHRAAT